MQHCVVCDSPYTNTIFSLPNIPKAAQYFPETVDSNLKDDVDISIIQCQSCGHVQSIAPLVSYYKDVITASSISDKTIANRESLVKKLVSILSRNDPCFLEIGCYKGQFVSHLISMGYTKSYGIEHSRESVENATYNNLLIKQGYVLDDDFDISDLPDIDILLCFNFLEHIPRPFEFLCKLQKYLSSESIVYFSMPSFDFISSSSCMHEFVPDHISYFSIRSLRTLFNRASFEVLEINSINNNNDLEIIAKYKKPALQNIQPPKFYEFTDELNGLIGKFSLENKTISFWGAGHRNLTLISQLDFNNISFIIDSATFKQGLYSPVSRLPIISPITFQTKMTDILFVSLPGIYNDEVIDTILSWRHTPDYIYRIDGLKISPVSMS